MPQNQYLAEYFERAFKPLSGTETQVFACRINGF